MEGSTPSRQRAELDIFQLFLVHAEIVPELVDDREPDLLSHFGFAGADRFDALLLRVTAPYGACALWYPMRGRCRE
jgi:hypothetical protein